MAIIAGQINPANYPQPDYSGVVRSAQMQAQGLADIGKSISGVIDNFGAAKKEQKKVREERKKIDAETKAGRAGIESAIKLGDLLGFDVKGMLSPVLDRMDDPNTTPMEAAALGREASSQIANILNLGFKAQDQKTQQANLMQDSAYKNAQLDIAQQNANSRAQSAIAAGNAPPANIDMPLGDGSTKLMQWDGESQSYVPVRTSGLTDTSTSALGNLPDPLKPFAKDFEVAGAKYGVAPNILAAISMHETANGTSPAFRNKNNAMGISDASGPVKVGSVAESIDKMASLLGRGINEGTGPYANAKSIADIANIYAPPGAGNDPKNLNQFWTQGVTSNIQKLSENQAEQVQPTPQNQGGIGFTPAKTAGSETYRPFTPEEIALYGSQGQVSSTGKVYPIRPPTGTKFTTNPDGSVTYETGAGVGAKAEGVAKAQEQMKGESFRMNQANTEEAFGRLDVAGTNNPLFAAGNSLLAKALPASEVGELESFFERINGENSFVKMSQLRASSPTGGAAGTMTEKEWPRFEGRFSPLKANAQKDTLAKSLSLNLLNAFEAANGMPEDIIKAFDEKRIDQAAYDKYVNDYVMNRQIARVNANGVDGKSYDWTRLNKKLLSKSTIFEAPSTSGMGLTPDEQQLVDEFATKK
jgi:hypothetical protein